MPAADIVVRRCTVQVVRHGGWSWGPQPRHLMDQVLAALPGLIAERLANLVPEGASENVEITEPVRIAASLSLADLLSGRFGALDHVAAAAEPLPEPAPALGPALPRVVTSPSPGPPLPHQASLVQHTPHQDARTQPRTLAEFIGMLYERGELGQVLALLRPAPWKPGTSHSPLSWTGGQARSPRPGHPGLGQVTASQTSPDLPPLTCPGSWREKPPEPAGPGSSGTP